MNSKQSSRRNERKRLRIRSKLLGTPERPRLYIKKTNKYLYAQIIDDVNKKVVTSLSTLTKEMMKSGKSAKNLDHAKKLGADIAKAAQGKGISAVIFDRGIYVYHGKIKTFAESARENGLKF